MRTTTFTVLTPTFKMSSCAVPTLLLGVAALFAATAARAERIKDMAQVQGVRTNQLVGYGLVVGLNGTGDQTSQAPFTVQSLENMLAQLGVTVALQRDAAAQKRGGRRRARRIAGLRQTG